MGAGHPTDPGTPGAQDCDPFPWQGEIPEDELVNNTKEDKDDVVRFIDDKSCRPKQDDTNKTREYKYIKVTYQVLVSGEGIGPVSQTPHLQQDLEPWFGDLLCLC